MIVEGVTYQRFVVRYTLLDGRRRSMVRWSPKGGHFVRMEVARELDERYGLKKIKPHSVTIKQED